MCMCEQDLSNIQRAVETDRPRRMKRETGGLALGKAKPFDASFEECMCVLGRSGGGRSGRGSGKKNAGRIPPSHT